MDEYYDEAFPVRHPYHLPLKTDSDDDYWIDATVLTSMYEQQFNARTKQHRYREFRLNPCDLFGHNVITGDWKPGLAPDAKSKG